ncbi:hypothetical protein AVEN_106874-1 [Araneus ventricosus]|uniref:Integrase catalytic domain-containing protein n=1 Tax=Araneus ventricosus TaxID=182803 RepID=A0A4Y2KIE1_ARAVE|nr:hypothetical protein AVEN_106874-1 [Araneus ventricosus]
MAPLPANRIQASYPFENVGIDFAGPIYTKNTDKAYIALFACAVTRAIHLEVVSSLSTEHFLLAFRRFISRRGICHTVNSDNAMTFKGADIELKRLYMNICEPEVQNYFGKKGIKWQYIVERAAWWGGYWERMVHWERMVQITKIALRKILGRALVSFEELQTILAEIESIINSRPLTYVYNEPFPLTPANFLTGRRLTALPNWSGKRNIELFKGKKELIKRYLYREKILNIFWKRWKREYLLQLKGANLNKNVNVKTEFNVNDIVLIGEEKVPRQLWKLLKVIDIVAFLVRHNHISVRDNSSHQGKGSWFVSILLIKHKRTQHTGTNIKNKTHRYIKINNISGENTMFTRRLQIVNCGLLQRPLGGELGKQCGYRLPLWLVRRLGEESALYFFGLPRLRRGAIVPLSLETGSS